MAKGLQLILCFYIGAETPWWIMFFCPNWAFNIAKVGSKSLPKSEVWSINSDPYQHKKPRLCRGFLY
jgi:hypothetical protein